jgi:hypothetical protein
MELHPENLATLKDDMVAFIVGHGLRRMPGRVGEDIPCVVFEDEGNPDAWKDFVEMAKTAGSPFVTMHDYILTKADLETLMEGLRDDAPPNSESPGFDEAQLLVNYVGRTGYLQLGFGYQGILYVYEISTGWYERFQRLMATLGALGGDIFVDGRDNDE